MNRKPGTRNVIIASVVGVMFVSVLCIAGDRDKNPAPRDVTLTGRIVDLQSFMNGKFASADKARCTRECIRAGVPAAIETDDGLIVIGEGTKGAARTLAPFAYENAELKGKLYERHGLRYIDITSAKAARAKPAPEPEADVEEPWTPEPDEATSGACCLPDGTCVDTDEDGCGDREGSYYAGSSCDDIDCE